jgi:chromosome segregation ATPase
MPRTTKPIEEQLREAQERKARITARLQALEAKKRKRDSKARGKAQQTLMRVVLHQMASQPGFKNVVAELVKVTPLRPDELEAIEWLLASLDQPAPPGAAPAPVAAVAPVVEESARVA